MSAFYLAEHIITDPAKFEEYRVKVLPIIEKYGGRYLTKGGTPRFPERPHWKPQRAVIIEFPNIDSLNAWYFSEEYQPLMRLRKDATSAQDMVIILEAFRNGGQSERPSRRGTPLRLPRITMRDSQRGPLI